MEHKTPLGHHRPEGSSAWIISDGKAGHEIQCLGVAEALGLKAEIKRVAPRGPFRWAAPWGPVTPSERFGKAGSSFAPPWPAFAFATGRTTIPYIRALRRHAGLETFTIVLMDPRTGPATADLVWVPEHDQRTGANVIRTLTSPHRYSPARLADLRRKVPSAIAALPRPRIAVLIGGPNAAYSYPPDDIARLGAAIAGLAATGAGLMLTPSRRTPAEIATLLREIATERACILWDGHGENPYADFLANADAFVVTADSINMTCEAAATGRPIYVFTPSGSGAKFQRFHAALAAYGATRPLPDPIGTLETWSYEPLDSAHAIAEEIARRWRIRCNLLPGLVSAGGR